MMLHVLDDVPPRGPLRFLERVSHRWVVPALLLLFLAAGFFSLRADSATSDETAHIGAGVSYLDRLDFRISPSHPPLLKMWACLPLEIFGLAHADYETTPWRGTAPTPSSARTLADEWLFGFETINGPLADRERRDPAVLLVPARCMVLILGVALGALVYVWSKSLWGRAGALLSLFLFCLSPTMLAHTRLVTTDLAAAAGIAAASFALRSYLLRGGWVRLVTTGVVTGAALLAKFSTLLLAPMFLACTVLWVFVSNSHTSKLRKAAVAAFALTVVAGIAWGVIWAGYGFRFAASTDPDYVMPWESRMQTRSGIPPAIELARQRRLLPEAFLFGVTSTLQDQVRLAYLNGRQSDLGWRSYFPIAFALKTPPAFIALSAWALCAGFRRKRIPAQEVVFVVVPLIVYAGFAVQSRLNIGHRHLAPLDPFLLVGCGAIPSLVASSRIRGWIATALLAGAAGSFVAATPGYLSYFNVFAGGARGGARHLLDSNIDWGQDLARLAAWLRTHHVDRIHLAYFGTADPKAYGIDFTKVFIIHDFRPDEPASRPGSGERLAVSVNFLQGLFLGRDRELAEVVWRRGWMPLSRIQEYPTLRLARLERAEAYPTFGDWAIAQGYLEPAQIEEASAGLLATWMERVRKQGRIVGRVGDSILVIEVP